MVSVKHFSVRKDAKDLLSNADLVSDVVIPGDL